MKFRTRLTIFFLCLIFLSSIVGITRFLQLNPVSIDNVNKNDVASPTLPNSKFPNLFVSKDSNSQVIFSKEVIVIILISTLIASAILMLWLWFVITYPVKIIQKTINDINFSEKTLSINTAMTTDRLNFASEISALAKSLDYFIYKLRLYILEQGLLLEITNILNQYEDFENCLKLCLESICKTFEWPVGHAYFPRAEGEEDVFMSSGIWYLEDEEKFLDFHTMTMSTPLDLKEGSPGSIFKEEPAWIDNWNESERVIKNNLFGTVGLPLKISGKVIAILEFFSYRPILDDKALLFPFFKVLSAQLSHVFDQQIVKKSLQLTQENQRTICVMNKAREAYVAYDANFSILAWNEQAVVTFGWNLDEVLGKNFIDIIIPKDNQADFYNNMKKYFSSDEDKSNIKRFEILAKRKNNETFFCEISPTPTSAFIYDITSRKLHDKKLKRTLSALEKSNAELEQFAYVASHDLRAPLRGISTLAGWIEEELKEKLSDRSKKDFSDLKTRVHRLDSLVAGILDYSKVSFKNTKRILINVNELLETIISNLAPSNNVNVLVDCDLPILRANQVALTQVFINLITNAIRHTDKAIVNIHIGCEQKDKFYQFYVRDDGPGIDKVYHDVIFALFQTLNSQDDQETTGIGLTITKKIIEKRGGKIWVESALGKGCTFYFTWKVPQKIMPHEVQKLYEQQ